MSNTFKTSAARLIHKKTSCPKDVRKQLMPSFEKFGHNSYAGLRHGNSRKALAAQKIQDRRLQIVRMERTLEKLHQY